MLAYVEQIKSETERIRAQKPQARTGWQRWGGGGWRGVR